MTFCSWYQDKNVTAFVNFLIAKFDCEIYKVLPDANITDVD